jgi:hypothetical protein
MSDLNKTLFSDDDLILILENSKKRSRNAVDEIAEAQFLASSDDELFQFVLKHNKFPHLEWYPDQKVVSEKDVKFIPERHPELYDPDDSRPTPVHGVELTFEIPFTGSVGFWKLRPSTIICSRPFGTFREDRQFGRGWLDIRFRYPADSVNSDEVKRELDQNIQNINIYLEQINIDLDAHHKELELIIRAAIEHRRRRIGRKADLIHSLAIPLKRNPNAPDFQPVPLVRRYIDPLPQPKEAELEYTITDEAYEYILKVIRHEGRTYEALRKTFKHFGEEDLRNVLLAHLNGHFEGLATGEAFRGAGKTDILIPFANRAAFVAECKVWEGQKEVPAALEQLQKYTTWRDLKVALIFFNKKNKGFSAVQESLKVALRAHPNFRGEIPNQPFGEWQFIIRSINDPDQLMTVHVFLFDVHVQPETDESNINEALELFADITQKVDASPANHPNICTLEHKTKSGEVGEVD